MNTPDILKYGNLTVLKSLEGLPEADWLTPGVCGVWSVRDIMAHLASYEQWHYDIFNSILDPNAPTPTLQKLLADYAGFNDNQVAERQSNSVAEIFAEYNMMVEKNAGLISQIPGEFLHKNGILPWYGADYDLDDFLVYTSYGHKREHTAQIDAFRDRTKRV